MHTLKYNQDVGQTTSAIRLENNIPTLKLSLEHKYENNDITWSHTIP